MKFSRRDFIGSAALGSASLAFGLEAQERKETDHKPAQSKTEAVAPSGKRPVVICANNGRNYIERGYEIVSKGGDTLEAVMSVIRGPEDDPNDTSVGLGGLPNEEGVVELDSCCMHGPTRRAGSVGGVRNIKNVSLLAKAVMEHTGHVMLVGEGAERFAYAMGFPKENLLTEHSRKVWLLWKEMRSNQDWWGPGIADPNWKPPTTPPAAPASEQWRERIKKMEEMAAGLGIAPELRLAAIEAVLYPPHGTINCSVVNEKGEMSSATTTSGLAWKLPGRCGDSPILGAGCWCDQDVGSAGATGSGEENIKVAGAHTIVENMRHGMSPREAGLDALKRIARNHNNDMTRLRYLDMVYYILRKDGAYAGVSLWSGSAERPRRFAVHDGTARSEDCVPLFQGAPIAWPPTPRLPKES
ncbi:MAG TPA: N(4)-(beta-N-acetylglucosaminyl)-L-asparaginase [Terriglobales bacterium]|nr:N(4)-(beta-N-acetylglucosaminyl)-L-asparaginase [Terriglobales bacterium]